MKEQELRNERLSVKLQQRPEADDVRAMQTQMASLHMLMEHNTTEHERETGKLKEELKVLQEEKEHMEKERQELKDKMEEMPKVEVVDR